MNVDGYQDLVVAGSLICRKQGGDTSERPVVEQRDRAGRTEGLFGAHDRKTQRSRTLSRKI